MHNTYYLGFETWSARKNVVKKQANIQQQKLEANKKGEDVSKLGQLSFRKTMSKKKKADRNMLTPKKKKARNIKRPAYQMSKF